MTEFFGRIGSTAKPVHSSYDQSTILETLFRGVIIAKGQLTSLGFILIKGSLVKKTDTFKDNPGIIKTRNTLVARRLLINSEQNPEYFVLQKNIGLSSPSTAARLVHGNGRDGLVTWMHKGIKLNDLLQNS